MIIPVFDDGSVLIQRQYRHAVKKIFWEFPAGKIDPGESVDQTAARELREETGYTATKMKWLTTIHPVIGYADEHIEIFIATGLKPGVQQLDPGEMVELHQRGLTDLLQMVRSGEITDVKTQIGVFWLEKFSDKTWAP